MKETNNAFHMLAKCNYEIFWKLKAYEWTAFLLGTGSSGTVSYILPTIPNRKADFTGEGVSIDYDWRVLSAQAVYDCDEVVFGTNMFPSGVPTTHHRLHPSATNTTTANFNFVSSAAQLSAADQNSYLYTHTNSNSPLGQTVATLTSGPHLGLPSSPISQYNTEIGAPLPPMSTEVLQPPPPPPLTGPHTWYSMTQQPVGCPGRGSMVAASPFVDEWSAPNTGSPLSASSPVSSLPPCALASAMPMHTSYGQPLQMGAYHPHGVHRADPYSEHLHHIPHHYHTHPYQNSGIIAQMNSEVTSVHPSPDSGLTASSDGTESPNAHHNDTSGMSTTPNGTVIKSENNTNGANRPQPARSPYEWMKKPSYQNQTNPSKCKTRTKDKYRVVYTDHQRLELEKEFHYSRYITIRRKSELASMLSLSERQVKIWFQNRRAKERKQAKKRDEVIRKDHHNNPIMF
ncbi:homeobox protein Hox-A4-like [Oppia nitens]|uniref:homeobox protein Hox-A4-like n=1 Tax=Oppia nitens TaxID=1686743 RepID=UPI0023DA2E53|nr:homeobox protein Hox-A4-like [Oppia nitens]